MHVCRSFALVATIAVASPVRANVVPKLSPEMMLAQADVAGVVRVTGRFTGQSPARAAQSECWNAIPITLQKGTGDPPMVICLREISEVDPPALQVGQTYQVYLSRSPSGILLPITKDSWISTMPV
jgi:hypothetical protein